MGLIMEYESLEYSLLSTQRALFDVVTPELRAVVINVDTNRRIFFIYFYCDGKASEKMIDLWQCATTEATADSNYWVDDHIVRLDCPKEIPLKNGVFAYLRKEPKLQLNCKKKLTYEKFSVGNVQLAAQQALLGVVTPELRAVVVDVEEKQKLLYVRFYRHGEISNEIKMLWLGAMKDASNELNKFEYTLDGQIVRLDFCGEQFRSERGRYAYMRMEG